MKFRAPDIRQWLRLTLLLCLTGINATAMAAAAVITAGRLVPGADHTRLELDLSGSVTHKVFTLSGPDRLVIDLSAAKDQASLTRMNLAGSPVSKVRTGPQAGGGLRIVLDLAQPVTHRAQKDGNRLVVDLYAGGRAVAAASKQPVTSGSATSGKKTAPAPKPAPVAAAPKNQPAIGDIVHGASSSKRKIIVVVDPGHGGNDPGAIGPKGVREKAIVLAISKELERLIDGERGYVGKLTRDGDVYIPLRKRTQIARKHGADLFISVHADAHTRTSARGASVWTLSDRGATSETGRWLAQRENASDLIGGTGNGVSLDDMNDVLAEVLLDMSMTASLHASMGVGKHVLKSVGRVGSLHKHQVEKAGFAVLKSPDIPSILVETGFISNPAEAQRLNTRKYQQKIARAIFDGLRHHFNETPPPGSLLAWEKDQKLRARDTASSDPAAAAGAISRNDQRGTPSG